MKIAVVSDDFRTLTGKVEDARRFLLFEAQKGKRPQLEKYFELPVNCQTYQELRKNEASFHPIDGMVIIASDTQPSYRGFFARRGIRVHVTSVPDPHTAVALWLDGALPSRDRQFSACGDPAPETPGRAGTRRDTC